LYSLSIDGSNVGLFSVKLNGTGTRRVTPDTLVNPHGGSWSPTGDRIVFQAAVPGQLFSIWIVNADGTGLRQVPIPRCGTTVRCRLPSWSPDGTLIVFGERFPTQTNVSGIFTVRPDGTGLVQLTNNGLGDWAPDWGTRVAA
jgi:Tol biopolymer transport system component